MSRPSHLKLESMMALVKLDEDKMEINTYDERVICLGNITPQFHRLSDGQQSLVIHSTIHSILQVICLQQVSEFCMSWGGLCLLELDDGLEEVWGLLYNPLDQQAGVALESLNVLFFLL